MLNFFLTATGTSTDGNGAFSLDVADGNAVLVFSYIGFTTQEIALNNRRSLTVVLSESSFQIDEVVVVAYGAQKRANLTGAVEKIGGERLENRAVQNITQALQGTIANLNVSTSNGAPGSTQSINIRGYAGLGSTRSPLVVIDGIQGGDLNNINMNDVESITVLKDAASSAIYGSSAPYGVIIVTTKKGRSGKTTITYNNNFGYSQPINLPHYVNSLEFAGAFNEAAANAFVALPFDDGTIDRIKQYMAGTLKDETMRNPTQDDWLTFSGSNANNDWFDIFFKDFSFSQMHNIGLSGGNERSNYYAGIGYNQQDGLYNWANDVYQRYNARLNLSSEIAKWLTVNLRSTFSNVSTDVPAIYSGVSGGSSYSRDYFHQLGRTWPSVALRNPDGNYSEPSGVVMFTQGGRNKSNTDRLSLTGEVVLRPLEGWNITANYTYFTTYGEASNHRKTVYITRPSGAQTPRSGTSPNYFQRGWDKNQNLTFNAFTSYEKNIGDHYISGLVGFTQELYKELSFQGANQELLTDELPMLSLTNGNVRAAADDTRELAIRGFFARINYNYKGKYLLELNGRYDGTSRFLKDNRNRTYPGVSAAWVPSGESFWEPVQEYVNYLKLRASYGSLGDQGFTSNWYPFFPALGNQLPTGTNYIFSSGRQSYFNEPGLVDMNLTWVTTTSIGYGIDLHSFNHRLNVSFDWYRRYAKDFTGPAEALPALLGTSPPSVNNAEIETTGFEITLGWKDRAGNVSYGIDAVLSDYQGRVTKYNNPRKLLANTWYDGMVMGEIWGFETVGLFQSEEEIANAPSQRNFNANWYPGDVRYRKLTDDGEPIGYGDNTVDNPGDQRIIGNSTPRYSFGVNMHAEWKGIDVTAFLQGVGKRDIMFADNANFFWGFTGDQWQSSYFTVHRDRWTTDNPDGYFPLASFAGTNKNRLSQTRYLQNAAYLRIKNTQIGYTIPAAITGKVKIQKARIFTNVENLATFTKLMKIIDPEIVDREAKVYPLKRTWAFGINVTL